MSHLSKVEVSPFRRSDTSREVGRGMGSDERARASARGSSFPSSRRQHERCESRGGDGREHPACPADACALPTGWRGICCAQVARASIEPSPVRSYSADGPFSGAVALRGFWPDARGREAGRASWCHRLARDAADLDGRGRSLALTQAAPDVPPAAAAARVLRRADPDRWVGSPLVRGSRTDLHPSGLH